MTKGVLSPRGTDDQIRVSLYRIYIQSYADRDPAMSENSEFPGISNCHGNRFMHTCMHTCICVMHGCMYVFHTVKHVLCDPETCVDKLICDKQEANADFF